MDSNWIDHHLQISYRPEVRRYGQSGLVGYRRCQVELKDFGASLLFEKIQSINFEDVSALLDLLYFEGRELKAAQKESGYAGLFILPPTFDPSRLDPANIPYYMDQGQMALVEVYPEFAAISYQNFMTSIDSGEIDFTRKGEVKTIRLFMRQILHALEAQDAYRMGGVNIHNPLTPTLYEIYYARFTTAKP